MKYLKISITILFLSIFVSLTAIADDVDYEKLQNNPCADPKLNEKPTSLTESQAVCIECLANERKATGKLQSELILENVLVQEQQKRELDFFKKLTNDDDENLIYVQEQNLKYYQDKIAEYKAALEKIKGHNAFMYKMENGKKLSTVEREKIKEILKNAKSGLSADYKIVQNNSQYHEQYLGKFNKYFEAIEAVLLWEKNGENGKSPHSLTAISDLHPYGNGLNSTMEKIKTYEKNISDMQDAVKKAQAKIDGIKKAEELAKTKSEKEESESVSSQLSKFEKQFIANTPYIATSNYCGMSIAEVVALRDYTRDGYREVNGGLRSGGEDAKEVQSYRDVLNAGLKKLARYSGNVNRGADLPPDVLKMYQVGAIVDSPAFTSTSVARGFSRNHRFVIKSKTGVYIDTYSANSGELEVLIPAGAKFKVLERKKSGSTIHFVLEQIE